MRNLSSLQRKVAAEILGNISVAWFSAGVISPLFLKPRNIIEAVFSLSAGLIMAGIFASLALSTVKGAKS